MHSMNSSKRYPVMNGLVILAITLMLTACLADDPRYPFPQHVDYGADTLLPNQYARTVLDDDVRAFYDYWKDRYLAPAGMDTAGQLLFRVAFGKPGSEQYGTTVSEGQGFGMIIVALMAGYDPEAKAVFDGLWSFARAHPSSIDPGLMSWRVSLDSPSADDHDSAFDGDVDMAYALLLANRQWGERYRYVPDAVDYAEAASQLLKAILHSTIGPDSHLPLLGDWVEAEGETYNQYTQRSSDVMLANFQAFADFTGQAEWAAVADQSRRTLLQLQRTASPYAGLLPDFIQSSSAPKQAPRPAAAHFLEGEHDGDYFYNANRVPLRVGMDALFNRNSRSQQLLAGLSTWMESYHSGNPATIQAGYTLDGYPLAESAYFSSAFVAPLGVAAMAVPGQQTWLNSIYDAVRQEHQDYYEDSLTLLSLLVMTGNFWNPSSP